jgi:dipeptidyl aminopeptidase/acylaminoacyl peptidase
MVFPLAITASPGGPVLRRLVSVLCLLALTAGSAAAARDHVIVPEDYFSLVYAGTPAISPDGAAAAWIQSGWEGPGAGRKAELWVMDLKEAAPRRLTFDVVDAGHPRWSPDGRWLYFDGREDGGRDKPPYDGKRQVWRIRPDGTDRSAVTRVEGGVGLWDLARDGAALYYTDGVEHRDEPWQELKSKWGDLEYGHGVVDFDAVRRLDLRSWRETEVAPPERVINGLALSPDGARLALLSSPDDETINDEGWSRIDVVELATGLITTVTPPEWRADHPSPFGWLTEMAWAHDGDALAFGISYDGYAAQIWIAERRDAAWNLFRVERPGSVGFDGGLGWRGKARTLLYRGEERGRVQLMQVDGVRGGAAGATRALTGGDVVVTDYAFDPAGKAAVVCADELDRTGDVYDLEKGALRRLTDVNPQMAAWQLPQIRDYAWTGADGETVHGVLELPYGHDPTVDGPLPGVIELHGGPTSSTRIAFRLWIYGRALLPANGYALLSPNYHGSTGYGDAFTSSLVGRENEIEVTDIALGTERLIADGLVDPARIGVMGWSNGGFLTNCMIVARPDLYAAASSGAGVIDQVIQWGIEDTPGHVVNFMEGLPWESGEHYRTGSPLYGLDRVTTPTLIHVGGDDPRVPPAHSLTLYRALQHYLHVPVELVVYPGEGHGLSTYENRLAKMEWDLAWFGKYLKGEE